MELGAVIAVVLLVPDAVAVIVEKLLARGQHTAISDRSHPLTIGRNTLRDRVAAAYASVVCLAIAAIVVVVFVASFVTLWPYNLHLSLRHYRFEVQNGVAPLWTSIVVSIMAAVIGVVVTVAAACVMRWLRPVFAQSLYFMSVLPAAVPGMVLGLGYILVFNNPANPLEFLYGSLLILAICNIYHYHAQGFLIATTSIGQVSRVFDETSTCLGAGMLRTLRAVVLPIVAPAVNIGVSSSSAAWCLSAVIFRDAGHAARSGLDPPADDSGQPERERRRSPCASC